MTAMLNQLEKFYRDNGILSTEFSCEHLVDCKGDWKDEDFTEAKSAYIGSGYEVGKLPNGTKLRLLFLSADPGCGNQKPKKCRLPDQVRKGENEQGDWMVRDLIKGQHKAWHWYRTYELAWYILKRFDSRFEEFDDVKGFFAHANSAKCCMNKFGCAQADQRLFDNCKGYLDGELKLLAPNLLVTQGKPAKHAVTRLVEITKKVEVENAFHCILHGKPVFWLRTDHPRYARGFNAQRKGGEGWEFYAEEMYRFINRPQSG